MGLSITGDNLPYSTKQSYFIVELTRDMRNQTDHCVCWESSSGLDVKKLRDSLRSTPLTIKVHSKNIKVERNHSLSGMGAGMGEISKSVGTTVTQNPSKTKGSKR